MTYTVEKTWCQPEYYNDNVVPDPGFSWQTKLLIWGAAFLLNALFWGGVGMALHSL
jgi:hypothetical protein